MNKKLINRKFPFLTLSICLAGATCILFSLYSTIHWPLSSAYKIKLICESKQSGKEHEKEIDTAWEEIKKLNSKIIKSGHSAMRRASLYHLTGLSGFIISIFAIFREKGVMKFLPLPFGLISGFLALIIM